MFSSFQNIIRSVLISILCVLFLIGCSSGGNKTLPVVPDASQGASEITENSVSTGQNTHYLLMYSLINIDATNPDDVKVEMVPVREGEFHLNILKFLEFSPCTDCLKIVGVSYPEPGTLDVDIEITHPFDDLKFTAFDVRGIVMFNGSHTFPVSGLTMSDSKLGDGEFLNAEGFTRLYNGSTLGLAGDLFTYFKGKLATSTVPNADLNGFIYHISSNPANTRNALYPADSVTRTYRLDLPSGQSVLGYAVDASWDLPTADPVTDPMTQFPATANCIEPWGMLVTEEKIGDGLTTDGGQTKLIIDVYDWQGKGSHLGPIVECPDLFTGQIPATFLQVGDGYARFEAIISNALLASFGNYKVLLSVEDNANASAPEWIDLIAYLIFDANVGLGNGTGNLLWAKSAVGTHIDFGWGITTLSDNSTVVTGHYQPPVTFGPGDPNQTVLTSGGIFIARYNPDGTLAWAKPADWGSGHGITTLSDNSTVVTGNFSGLAPFGPGEPNETELSDGSIFIARYNPNGTLAWAKNVPGSENDDSGYGITALSDNSTVVTGNFREWAYFGSGEPNETVLTAAGFDDIFVARFNPDGTLAWAKRAGGEEEDDYADECGNGITALSDNSTVVTGKFWGPATFGPGEPNETELTNGRIFIACYNPDGTLAWAKSVKGSAINDYGFGITTLSDNSTVVTGQVSAGAIFGYGEPNETVLTTYGNIFIARYNPDGTLAWVKNPGGESIERGFGITALSDDSIVVTGTFSGSATFGSGEPNQTVLTSTGFADIFVARYNPDGSLAWAKHAAGVSGWEDESGYGITSLSDNSTVATGCFSGSATFGPGEPNETVLTSTGDYGDIFIARFEP